MKPKLYGMYRAKKIYKEDASLNIFIRIINDRKKEIEVRFGIDYLAYLHLQFTE